MTVLCCVGGSREQGAREHKDSELLGYDEANVSTKLGAVSSSSAMCKHHRHLNTRLQVYLLQVLPPAGHQEPLPLDQNTQASRIYLKSQSSTLLKNNDFFSSRKVIHNNVYKS